MYTAAAKRGDELWHCLVVWQVFIQRAAVNLLSTVLDTPEFFWSAPDIMQTLYKRICEYMELDDRVEVLNNRFAVCITHSPAMQPSQSATHGAFTPASIQVLTGR